MKKPTLGGKSVGWQARDRPTIGTRPVDVSGELSKAGAEKCREAGERSGHNHFAANRLLSHQQILAAPVKGDYAGGRPGVDDSSIAGDMDNDQDDDHQPVAGEEPQSGKRRKGLLSRVKARGRSKTLVPYCQIIAAAMSNCQFYSQEGG